MSKEIEINLSLIDTVKKYSYDTTEIVYNQNAPMTWGRDNDIPNLLRNCYEQSATLKSIIDGSVNYILGETINVSAEIACFEKQVNSRGMTMRQLLEHIASDYYKYGNFAIQVIFSKMNTLCELYPLDITRCRLNESQTKVFYSKKGWTKYQTKSDVFDRFDRKHIDPEKKTQIFIYNGNGIQSTYAKAPWAGSLNDVLTEIECSAYSLNSVSNGFQAKYVLNIPSASNLTNEQKNEVEKQIKQKFCGADTGSNFMVYFNNGEKDGIKVEKIESDDTPEKFIAIKNNARTNIYTSLRCTPNLFGLPDQTTGFNSQEYSAAFKLYQKTVIEPVQRLFIECLDKIFAVTNCITIEPFQIKFE